MQLQKRLATLEAQTEGERKALNHLWGEKYLDHAGTNLNLERLHLFIDLEKGWEAMTPEAMEAAHREYDDEAQRLSHVLNLDGAAWQAWADEIDNAGFDLDDPGFTVACFPPLPHDPTEALELAKTFDFPLDARGLCRWRFFLYFAAAKAQLEVCVPK